MRQQTRSIMRDSGTAHDALAEEAGVEPTGDAAGRLPPDLKSGRPTGDVSLPQPSLPASPQSGKPFKVALGIKRGLAAGGDAPVTPCTTTPTPVPVALAFYHSTPSDRR